ncbi:hypothetical protein DMN91_007800 [Ooceraea biroi]|uniref:Uncharacterized protein n=1 Tax=Ooceraea biroi TaxID=2015173 RepID=A0A3L8DGD7_OOCBI|nr:hypothetical protein DMN91_007800 [Ooceraea biroi]
MWESGYSSKSSVGIGKYQWEEATGEEEGDNRGKVDEEEEREEETTEGDEGREGESMIRTDEDAEDKAGEDTRQKDRGMALVFLRAVRFLMPAQMLPYSRLQRSPATGVALLVSRVLLTEVT